VALTSSGLSSSSIELVKIKVTLPQTVCRPVRLGVRHPFDAHDQFFFPILSLIFFTVSNLLMWVALSDEKSCLYFLV
jgi:hypothetical protein